ncbi:serine/threonine protein kinase [Actinoplanes lutulentus]|uniref:Serine/threonine protein kinase n=2 Tax=Actinoplanes lutulentus TaxID=1287878 RepID=A0A327ZE89_9ACTN|nr:serine/threonine protein kinase [Actinoplanes lutulentus]
MGRVWRATDVVLHRDVAIKELVPPPGLTPAERQEMRERSLREARAIARLNNVNVVRVFDVLRTDADPWIVMEYVASRSLQDTLAADGPFNPVRAAEIGLGVLNALRAAHRAGVVHRDVKPGNVLMGADGRVVLTDFGLATVPGDPNVTRTGLVLGSPAYIAPERARDGTAGPAADLWSLGATLFAAVEGQSPFARPSAIATLAALATENVPPSRNAGPLKSVLNGLLRKDPAHRIDAEEAERLLARAAGRRSKIAFPMSPTMRRPGVGRERPSLPSGPGGPPVLPGSGWVTATGSAPVVPTPRPPVTNTPQGRPPANPPQRPAAANPQQPGRPQAGNPQAGNPQFGNQQGGNPQQGRPADGRPPIFAPGKAPVGGPAPSDAPPRGPQPPGRGPKPLDATRIDSPAVQDIPSTPYPPAPPGRPRFSTGTPSSAPVSPARVGFTAADVAANRRKKAAPEHEKSLAAATGAYPIVAASESAQATTMMPTGAPPVPSQERGSQASSSPASSSQASSSQASSSPETVAKPEKETSQEETSQTPATGSSEQADQEPISAEPSSSDETSQDETSQEAATGTVQEDEPTTANGSAQSGQDDSARADSVQAEPATDQQAAQADQAETADNADEAQETATEQPSENAPEPTETSEAAPAAKEEPSKNEPTKVEPVQVEPAKIEPAKIEPAADLSDDRTIVAPAAIMTPVARKPVDADKTSVVGRGPDADRTSIVAPLSPPGPRRAPATPAAPDNDRTSVVGRGAGAGGGFNRPSRPAWTPMPMRPPERRGITVLGTTLTHRQAAIGLGIVLTFLLLIGIIVVQAFGDDAEGATGANPSSGAVAAGNPSAAESPASQGEASKPAANSSPSAAPSTAASTAAAGVPAGWRSYNGSGFSLSLPKSASVSGGGSETRVNFNNRLVIINKVNQEIDDPVEYLQQQSTSHYRNYNNLGVKEVDYQDDAADWEFTYTTNSGNNAQHVVKRVFEIDDTAWTVGFYTSPEDWDAAKADLDAIFQGFKTR